MLIFKHIRIYSNAKYQISPTHFMLVTNATIIKLRVNDNDSGKKNHIYEIAWKIKVHLN